LDLKYGEIRDVTILFLDFAGFTKLTEKLQNPERIYHVITIVFGALAQIIRGHNGWVEKFIGDAVMAVWGVKQSSEYDAERAVMAAREMLAALEPINQVLKAIGVKLTARIGINAGPVVYDPQQTPELGVDFTG
jgi:class 3 adenylate cyclase